MMRRTDVFGDGLVLGEFEDGAGVGVVAVVVRRRGVGRVGGFGCWGVVGLAEGGEGDEGGIELEDFGRVREGGGLHGGVE